MQNYNFIRILFFVQSLMKNISNIVKYSTTDTIVVDNHNIFRGSYKPFGLPLEYYNPLNENPKVMNTFLRNNLQKDPIEILQLHPTIIQYNMPRYINKINKLGTLAFSCPCGSGKTLAGIRAIFLTGLQTLIISNRCAIKNQWRKQLLEIYPNIKVTINKYEQNADVLIYSPQYLLIDIDKRFPKTVGLIIYDEVHSLLSLSFSSVLFQPFIFVNKRIMKELPYMIALSASYPGGNTAAEKADAEIIKRIFGQKIECESNIVNIPVNVYDYRRHVKTIDHIDDNKMVIFKDRIDKYYTPLTDIGFIDYVMNNNCEYYNTFIEPTILQHNNLCGMIITNYINESVYAWLCFHKKYPTAICTLIRKNNEGYYTFRNNVDIPIDIMQKQQMITFEDIKQHAQIDDFCICSENIPTNCNILCGTYQRLKEGISINNAVWGICTMFAWSTSARIQILGRIRRTNKDEFINNYPRHFLVLSHKIKSNLHKIYEYSRKHIKPLPKPTIDYDEAYEYEVFQKENYIYV